MAFNPKPEIDEIFQSGEKQFKVKSFNASEVVVVRLKADGTEEDSTFTWTEKQWTAKKLIQVHEVRQEESQTDKSDTFTFDVDKEGNLTILKGGVPFREFNLRGPEGKPGKDGAPGQNGAQGQAGKDGADGRPGMNGEKGQDGKNGVDGAPGKDGQDGATYIPHITKDGELYFTNSKTSDTTAPFPVKGEDGKIFYPHIDGTELFFTEDAEGKGPEVLPRINLKGETGNDGRTYVPQMEGTKLHFDDLAGHTTSEVDLRGKDAFELWKEHHHKPDATYEEFEEYFKGQNIKSEYNYLDIKDTNIPIQRINRKLITDSDLTDGMTIEEFYEHRKNRIKDIRKEGANKTDNWFKEFFWWCAGADAPLLRMCPADHSKYVGIGTVIFFTALMAFFSCFTAMQLVFSGETERTSIAWFAALPLGVAALIFICSGIRRYLHRTDEKDDTDKNDKANKWKKVKKFLKKNKPGSLIIIGLLIIGAIWWISSQAPKDIQKVNIIAAIIAFVWAAMIFFLDRFITNTMYSDGKTTISWLEFRSGLPRIIISIFLGIVISAPLELKIFDNDIKFVLDIEKNQLKENINSSFVNKYEDTPEIRLLLSKKDGFKIQKEDLSKEQIEYAEPTSKDYPTDSIGQVRYKGDRWSWANIKINWRGSKRTKKAIYEEYNAKIQNCKDSITLLTTLINSKRTENNNTISKEEKNRKDSLDTYYPKNGLYKQLEAMHSFAMKDYRPLFSSETKSGVFEQSWKIGRNDNEAIKIPSKIGLGLAVFLAVLGFLWSLGKGFFIKKYEPKMNEELNAEEKADKKAFWWKYIPLMVIVSLILGFGLETLHQLISFLFTPVGLIMLLFILIDVSPVFYKMMLSDGEYDKMHYQDKMIEQDFIRLQVAKAMYKVNESELSKLSPFIFGKTFSKVEELIKRYQQNQDQKKALDMDISGLNKDISEKNSKLLSEVLDMKYRIAYAAYAAWYRDMRDYILGKKDDAEGATIKPENTLKDDLPNEETSSKQEEEVSGDASSTDNLEDMTM